MEKSLDIKRFLDDSGRITQLPQRAVFRAAVLRYLAEKFEAGQHLHRKGG